MARANAAVALRLPLLLLVLLFTASCYASRVADTAKQAAHPARAAAGSSRLIERDFTPLYTAGFGSNGADDSVPLVDPPKRVAGYFLLSRTKEAKMFYMYFQSRNDSGNDPLVVWLTGGPGCSSELAIMYENGPYNLHKNMSLSESSTGWDIGHNMIYVDQPIGVGFSYSNDPVDDVFDEDTVAADMLDFLQEFYKAHPEVAGRELYITGESYAGHYVPAVTYGIWKYNKTGTGQSINFKGLAIGNGLTNPAIQFEAYADFAYANQIIGKLQHDLTQAFYPICRLGINLCNKFQSSLICGFTMQYCQMTVFQPILASAPGINVYDIRKKCEGPLCYDFSEMADYLNSESIQHKLGVQREWVECSPIVYANFIGDWMLRYDDRLVPMLEDGIRVLIYAGDQDLICNWLGNRRWVDALAWSKSDEWQQAEDSEWSVDGEKAGSVKQAGPLSFVKVYNAGHMVPMDQGEAALKMITHFTRNSPLSKPSAVETRRHTKHTTMGGLNVKMFCQDCAIAT